MQEEDQVWDEDEECDDPLRSALRRQMFSTEQDGHLFCVPLVTQEISLP